MKTFWVRILNESLSTFSFNLVQGTVRIASRVKSMNPKAQLDSL